MRRNASMRTGTTGFEPMYPMIPHMRSIRGFPRVLSRGWCLVRRILFPAFHPAIDDRLTATCDAEPSSGDVLGDPRSGGHVCAFPHAHRRDQLLVGADEGAVFNHRLVFVLAVVVARDRPRADVHL